VTKTKHIGLFFLAGGSLILLGVAMYWLAAPFFIPSPPDISAVKVYSFSEDSAPALSPFAPPQSAAIELSAIVDGSLPDNITAQSSPIVVAELSVNPSSKTPSNTESDAASSRDRSRSSNSLRLTIPVLGIDAPVLPVSLEEKQSSRRPYQQWSVPDSYAIGWHDSSAEPGQIGNTVLNGHNNIHGAVFANLVDLTLGEQIIIYKADREYIYQVVHREFLPEQGEPLKTRLKNARWIAPSDDERLTIVTCWPNSSNSHRLVVIAQPQQPEPGY